MTVFVTGGSGFVGSYTVAALLARGHDVRLLVRSPEKADAVLGRRGVVTSKVHYVVGDMQDAAAVTEAAAGCDATVHTAAAIGVTSGGATSVLEQNTVGARTVIEAALAAGHDPIVHISSIAVFVPPSGPTITAASPLVVPRTDYGLSKVRTEQELRALQDAGRPITIIYPGGVLGPDQPTLDATIEGLVGARRQGWPLSPGGVGLIDVRDLADAIAAAVQPGQGPRRLVLGGHFFSWPDLGNLLDGVLGVRARRLRMPKAVLFAFAAFLDGIRRIRPVSYPLTRDAAQIMTTMVPTDDRPALDALGVTLRPIEESLEETMRWVVAAGHLDPKLAPRLSGA